MSNSSLGPVWENYRGVNIRQYPQVNVRVTIPEMKKFIDAKLDFGMSASEAIKNQKVLCKECDKMKITKYSPNEIRH